MSAPQSNQASPMSEEETKQFWNHYSETWSSAEQTTLPTSHTLLTCLLRNSSENEKILEIGCGTGGAIKLAISLFHSSTKFIGLDLSPVMIQKAQERLKEFSNQVTLQQSSAMALNFEDGYFNKVFSNYCLHIVLDLDVVLREIRRVLAENGMLAFSVWGRSQYSPRHTIVSSVIKRLQEEQNFPSTAPSRSPFHLNDLEATKKRVLEAGFKKVVAWYHNEVTNVFTGKEFFDKIVGQAPNVVNYDSKLSPEQIEIFHNAIIEEADKYFKEDKLIHSDVLMVVAFK